MQGAPPSVLFFCMACPFSRPPLSALLAAGIEVRAVVMPSPARISGAQLQADAPAITPRAIVGGAGVHLRALPLLGGAPVGGIAQLAAERAIPLLDVSRLADRQTVDVLASYAPDLICVVCFPWRLPAAILGLPRLGCVNLHPALLPLNRGPDPLFWTFRCGDAETGVTVHLMDDHLDAGPILAQMALPIPLGITEKELERECAELGGVMLAEAAWQLADGSARPLPQDETRATRFPWPGASDYLITPDRPARCAHAFARGVSGRGAPLRVRVAGQTFRLRESLGFDEHTSIDQPWRQHDDWLEVRCTPGIWHVRAIPTADME